MIHPFASVSVKVYVVVTAAFVLFTVVNAVFSVTPLSHTKVFELFPVKVTSSPLQTVWSKPALVNGSALTITVAEPVTVFEHVAFASVTDTKVNV